MPKARCVIGGTDIYRFADSEEVASGVKDPDRSPLVNGVLMDGNPVAIHMYEVYQRIVAACERDFD